MTSIIFSNLNKNPCNFLSFVVKYKGIVNLPVAQWIMRWTPTPKTAGSTPAGQARKFWGEERLAPQFSSNTALFAALKSAVLDTYCAYTVLR